MRRHTCNHEAGLHFISSTPLGMNERMPSVTYCSLAPMLQAHSFELELDTSNFKQYQRGGLVTQFKEPKDLK